MGKMSRNKGKVGEREWAKLCTKAGLKSHRGQQFAGRGVSGVGYVTPDVVHDNNDRLHCEVKRVEQLNLYEAIKQADDDSLKCQLPYVAHRKNGKQWLVTVQAPVFFQLLRDAGEMDECRPTPSEG